MRFWPFVPIPLLAILAGCTPFYVNYDYDPHASFAAFKTYDWYAASPRAKGTPGESNNPIMDRRVRRIVERELAARGYRRLETGEPDFLLTYYPVYRSRIVGSYTAMGGGWGWGRPWGYGVGGFQELRAYREGSMVLEVVESKSNLMVWQAVADGALTGLDDPQDAEEQVTLAVRRMLAKFPPPPAR
jgi:hypothetical protein